MFFAGLGVAAIVLGVAVFAGSDTTSAADRASSGGPSEPMDNETWALAF